MKSAPIALLLALASSALFAEPKTPKGSVEQTLMQMERDWSAADVKKDRAALDRILAEDWTGIDFQGAVLSKADVLQELNAHSDITATESTVLGEMKVRVYGKTALVSGTEVEKSQYRGRDSSGEYIWTDVFVYRGGRWQAVSSQSTKLAVQEGPKSLARLRQSGDGLGR